MRDALAQARLGVEPRRLFELNRAVFADPELFVLTGCTLAGGRVGSAVATPGALAMVLIGVLTDSPPARDWHSRIMRYWHAWPHTGHDASIALDPVCPITGQTKLGRSLTAILARPVLAARVVRLEVSLVAPLWTIWHRDGEGVRRAVYVGGIIGRELTEAMADVPAGTFTGLPGKTLVDLATLMARGAGKPRRPTPHNPQPGG